MLCERCQEREATVFITDCHIQAGHPEESTISSRHLCLECSAREFPEDLKKSQAQLAAGCSYCGRLCRQSVCARCSAELRRVMQEKGFSPRARAGRDEREKQMRIMQEVIAHMKKWVQENPPDSAGPTGAPFPPDEVFARLAAEDGRFALEAYRFVAQAVRAACDAAAVGAEPRHVTGREVAVAFRDRAVQEFGAAALATITGWGVYTTADLGTLVFQMIDAGLLGKRAEDRPEDFHAIYDFATAFRGE